MNCQDTRRLLDDYIDGDLPDRARGSVEAHVRDCPTCAAEADALLSLIAQARALPGALDPPRDLWPDIACRLDGGETAAVSRRAKSSVWHGLLAASIVAAAALGVATLSRSFLNGAPDEAPIAAADDGRSAEAAHDVGVALADAESGLRATFEKRRSELPPDTAAEVDRNLQIIEKAIDDIRVAVDSDPGNPKLNRMLVTAQRREVDFLQQVTRHTLLF